MTAPTVKRRLTAQRRSNVVENDDYGAFTRRVLAAHGRRVARGDIEGLTALATLATDVEDAISEAVTGLHHVGFSWTDIAARLGITRQAAHQRWSGDTR